MWFVILAIAAGIYLATGDFLLGFSAAVSVGSLAERRIGLLAAVARSAAVAREDLLLVLPLHSRLARPSRPLRPCCPSQ